MPLNKAGKKVMRAMKEQYGEKKGEQVFYATKNKYGKRWEERSPAHMKRRESGMMSYNKICSMQDEMMED
jgi:hypothetical protein